MNERLAFDFIHVVEFSLSTPGKERVALEMLRGCVDLDPNHQFQYGSTFLTFLVCTVKTWCSEKMIRALIVYGADVNASVLSQPVLSITISNSRFSSSERIVRMLLEAGSEPKGRLGRVLKNSAFASRYITENSIKMAIEADF